MNHDRAAIALTIALAVIALVYWSGMMEGRMEALEIRMEVIINGLLDIKP